MSEQPTQSAGKSTRLVFNLSGSTHRLPFNDAVQAGNTLYLSGRIGCDRITQQIPADLEQEIRIIFDELKEVLALAGMTLNHVASIQIFSSDLSLFESFNRVYRQYFTDYLPARAFLGSGPLLLGAHFEVCAIAVKD